MNITDRMEQLGRDVTNLTENTRNLESQLHSSQALCNRLIPENQELLERVVLLEEENGKLKALLIQHNIEVKE